jgi:hypothetical protein
MTEEETESGLGWFLERERRMVLEGLRDSHDQTPEEKERAIQIIRELGAEVKAGRVFKTDKVSAQWRRDDEERRITSSSKNP